MVVTRIQTGRLRSRGSIPDKGQEISLVCISSRPTLGPTQPPIQWVQEAVSLGLRQQKRETHHSHPSSGTVKNSGVIPPLLHTS
jgi:hypothetical protein